MKCSYCAEEIKDEAIVCRYCGRDLVLLKPILERLDSLEQDLSKLNTSFKDERKRLDSTVKSLQSGVSGSSTRTVSRTDFSWSHTIPIFLATISYGYLFYYLLQDSEETISDIFFIILGFAPILFGLWLGTQWRGSHLLSYILSGLVIGIGGTLGDWTAWGFFDWEIAVVVIPLAVFLFTTGGITGDLIERRKYGRPDTDGYSEKLAKRLVGSSKITPSESEQSSEDTIKTLSDIIAAMTPIFTFIAAIITSIVTYMVANLESKGG